MPACRHIDKMNSAARCGDITAMEADRVRANISSGMFDVNAQCLELAQAMLEAATAAGKPAPSRDDLVTRSYLQVCHERTPSYAMLV
jgi:hypothetical protein